MLKILARVAIGFLVVTALLTSAALVKIGQTEEEEPKAAEPKVARTTQTATPPPSPTTAPTPTKTPRPPKPAVDGKILLDRKAKERRGYDPAELFDTSTPSLAKTKYAADVTFPDGLWRGRVRIGATKADGYVRCSAWTSDFNGDQHWVYQLRTTKKSTWGFDTALPVGGLMVQVHRIKSGREDSTTIQLATAAQETSYVAQEDGRIEMGTNESEANDLRLTFGRDNASVSADFNVTFFDDSFAYAEGIGVAHVIAKLNCPSVSSDQIAYN